MHCEGTVADAVPLQQRRMYAARVWRAAATSCVRGPP